MIQLVSFDLGSNMSNIKKSIHELKHRFAIALTKDCKSMPKSLILINRVLFRRKDRAQKKVFGEHNPNKKIFVYRGPGEEAGLLSVYCHALAWIDAAQKSGYDVVVDLRGKTQYQVDRLINDSNNPWDYYFEQPSNLKLDDVYDSKNVFLSGWSYRKLLPVEIELDSSFDYIDIAPIKRDIIDKSEALVKRNKIEDMLGVFARGTDYVRLKPRGHAVQPDTQSIILKTKEFLDKYGYRKIFLATEDSEIRDAFLNEFGIDNIYSTESNYINKDYNNDFISHVITSDMYEFGLNYLVKMLCLSKCKYLVGGDAMGSRFAMKMGHFEDAYIFNLGVYK